MDLQSRKPEFQDEIDQFADDLVRHPERASDLKAALRRRIQGADIVRVAPRHVALDTSEPDDLWDNVPV